MRAVLSVFENYQKARVNFVQTVAEVSASRSVPISASAAGGYRHSCSWPERARHA